MNIRTRIRFLTIAAIVVLLSTGLSNFYILNHQGRINQRRTNIKGILQQTINLNLLAQDIVSYHNERAISQWQTAYQKLSHLVQVEVYTEEDRTKAYESLQESHIDLGRLFSALHTAVTSQAKHDREPFREIVRHKQTQLLFRSRDMASSASSLLAHIDAESMAFSNRAFILNIILTSLFAVCIFTSVYTSYTGEILPISQLRKDMLLIGEGNLDHEAKVILNNEIGDLTDAFNDMREKLKHLTVSREMLTAEIDRRQLTELELLKAKNAAEAASQAKSEFLANMSHEIRTPMNGVMGMLELLTKTGLSKKQQDFIRMASTSADSLLIIINDILDFSKIEAGQLKIEKIPFHLRDVLEGAVNTFAVEAHQKGLELACRIPPDIPNWFIGDPTRIRQILINLISNAVKFTKNGEVALTVSWETPAKHVKGLSSQLQFTLRDTGVGIPTDKQKFIFGAFSQADTTITRNFGGTGLGLAITSQLVALMNGRLWVESTEGQGSQFNVTLPLPQHTSAEEVTAIPSGICGMRVVAVDDNETNRLILEEVLQSWEMDVTICSSGPEAYFTMQAMTSRRNPPQLLITDHYMPEWNGLELAERVRETDCLKDTRILLLSSAMRINNHCDLIDASLTKPIRQSQLLSAIQRCTGNHYAELNHQVHDISNLPPPLHILLVEDSAINQAVALGLLKGQGHSVVLAVNGFEALDRMKDGTYDIVLMDVQMPGMDGLEATRQIRASHSDVRNHDVPIIAMTAHAMTGDKEKCLEAGMTDYISKPLRPDRLFELLALFTPQHAENPPPSTLTKQIFDLKKALEPVDGNMTLLDHVIDISLTELPTMMQDVEQAIAIDSPTKLRAAAHKLKGAISNFGAENATEKAQQLQDAGEKQDMLTARDGIVSLKKDVESLVVALKSYRDGGEL